MPIIKSAIKQMRQAIKARARNAAFKDGLRSAVKAFTTKASAEKLKKAQSEIDKAVKKNLLSKNTAARQKAALAKVAKQAGVKVTGAKKAAAPKAAKPAAKKAPVKKSATKKS
jgi:ribosomal protein S20